MATVRFLVAGLVQGVNFRASTRACARQLGVTGYARNLPDGRVEVLACGDAAEIARLEAWLREGPPAARVDALAREDLPEQRHAGFARL